MNTDARVRLAYLVSHPIQYQAPLLRLIAADPDIMLKVFFCSDVSVRAHHDEGFGRTIAWDTPLLEGYQHAFLPSLDDRGRLSLWRPINYGLTAALRRERFQVLWVHGYARWVHLLGMANAKRLGLKTLIRDEGTRVSARRGGGKRAAKRAFFTAFRQICDGALAIGRLNRDYWLEYEFPPERVFDMPYAVDNDHFRVGADQAARLREPLRAELGLAPGRPIILYASKLMPRKRPLDLLEAHTRLVARREARNPYLLFAGDGELGPALARRAAELGNDAVKFLGFRNQSELPRFYDLCDVFVLPSEIEPWGLVINEAMNAGRAVIASDECGCAADLVRNGDNGFVFRTGDVAGLADAIARVLGDPAACGRMGRRSREIIADHGFARDLAGLKTALDTVLR